jgi:hypothetical protein
LLNMPGDEHTQLLDHVEGDYELDAIPIVKRRGRGNWDWAEERCARRCGLRADELGLFQAASAAVKLGKPIPDLKQFHKLSDDIREQMDYTSAQLYDIESGLAWVRRGRRRRVLIKSRLHWLTRLAKISRGIRLEQYRIPTATGDARAEISRGAVDPSDLSIRAPSCDAPNTNAHASPPPDEDNKPPGDGHRLDMEHSPHSSRALDRNLWIDSVMANWKPRLTTGSNLISLNRTAGDLHDLSCKSRRKSLDDLDLLAAKTRTHSPKPLGRSRSVADLNDLQVKSLKNDLSSLETADRDAVLFHGITFHSFSTLTSWGSWPVNQPRDRDTRPAVFYVVVGWFSRHALDPRERLITFTDKREFFKGLKSGIRDIRGWRAILSLKSVQGFGLYKVGP